MKRIQTGVNGKILPWLFSATVAAGFLATTSRAQILQPPQALTVPTTFTASFSVAGSGITSYQWIFDGKDIPGATSDVLNVIDAQQTNAGSYSVQVTDSFGSGQSTPVTLTVTNVPIQAPSLQLTTLASFEPTVDGAFPECGVIQAGDGYLYGTSAGGGTNSNPSSTNGAVFKMNTNGTLIWAFGFSDTNGQTPLAGLVQAGDGNFYGATSLGGKGFGTVFRITANGVFSDVYSFTNGTDGGEPQAALCAGSDGYLYGTTTSSGTGDKGGTIFKMNTNGSPVWFYPLTTTNTGVVPLGGLAQGADGGLYGTTSSSAKGGYGAIFRIDSSGDVASNLYSFTNGTDGGVPEAGLIQAPDGQLYGTASSGGNTNINEGNGYGTVFKISTNGVFAVLATFDGTNGGIPEAGLFLGGDGNLYGATTQGGAEYPMNGNTFVPYVGNANGFGTLFQLTTNGTLTTLVSFDGNYNGSMAPYGFVFANSQSSLWKGLDGGLYGTTALGGSNNLASGGTGTLFRLSVVPPTIASATVAADTFSFTWNAMPGENYQAQYKDALDQPDWINFGGLVQGVNGVAGRSDVIGATNKARFYRVYFQF